MVSNGEVTTADIKRVLRKHWWILPTCALSFGMIALVVCLRLPKQYTSQTLVLVAKPGVPADYVRPVVTEDLTQRLASMKEQILSRSRLEPVIEKFNLYSNERTKLHMEDLVDRLRKDITITPLEAMPGIQDRSLPGFSVRVTYSTPQLAQQICTDITSMFMEQNARSLEQQVSRTTTFIGQQLEEAQQKLDQQDAKLAEFKRQHLGILPEQDQRNLSYLGSLNTELDATNQALTRTQQDRSLNETLLSQQEAAWKAAQKGQNPESLEEQLRARQEQLTVMESRYTEEHPDVVKLKVEIADLRKKIDQAPPDDDATTKTRKVTEPPQIQQLRARIRQEDLDLVELQKRQVKVQEQSRIVEGRIEASPMVELELKELTRNYQSALDFYNELLKKRDNSEMARDLVHQQEGEQFRVLDAPSLPTSPSFPIMTNFVGGGFGGGMVLGLVILYILMAMNKTFYTESEVEAYLKIPVLTGLPILDGAQARVAALKPSLLARD